MKRIPCILAAAAAVAVGACLDDPATEVEPGPPVVEPAADPSDAASPFRMITGAEATAIFATDVLGIPAEEVPARWNEIGRLTAEFMIEQKRIQLESASGPRVEQLRADIRGLERSLEILVAMDLPSAAAADGENACEGDPSITFANTSLAVVPGGREIRVVALASRSTEEDANQRVLNEIAVYNTETGESLWRRCLVRQELSFFNCSRHRRQRPRHDRHGRQQPRHRRALRGGIRARMSPGTTTETATRPSPGIPRAA